MKTKLLAQKESISLNGEITKTSLFKVLENATNFPAYESIISTTTKDREVVELNITGLHFNCPSMGHHMVGILDSEDADYGEIAWQMFENDHVMREPLPLGHIYACWNIKLLKGTEQAFKEEPALLENAIEKTLDLFRETVLPKDNLPLYFVYYGLLGYRSGKDDPIYYEDGDFFYNRDQLVPEAALHQFIADDGEEVRLFSENTLYNLFAKTSLTLFRCTGALSASKANYLAIHDHACIGNCNKKKLQTQIPILSPRKPRNNYF